MPVVLRAVISILTLVTVVTMVVFGVMGIAAHWPFMAILVCFGLAFGFGMFTFNDIKYWILYFQGKLNVKPASKV